MELRSKMSLRPQQDKDYKSMNRVYITSIPNDNIVQSRPKLVLNKLLVDHDKTLVTKWFNSKLTINDDISKLGNDLFQEACVFVAKSAKEQTLELDRKVTPRNLIEALEGVDSEKWKSALDKELTSLSDRNCFSICSTDDQDV